MRRLVLKRTHSRLSPTLVSGLKISRVPLNKSLKYVAINTRSARPRQSGNITITSSNYRAVWFIVGATPECFVLTCPFGQGVLIYTHLCALFIHSLKMNVSVTSATSLYGQPLPSTHPLMHCSCCKCNALSSY